LLWWAPVRRGAKVAFWPSLTPNQVDRRVTGRAIARAMHRARRRQEFQNAQQDVDRCTHPEETRVVVVRGNRVEEFDFETAQRKQLRGNIYLAKSRA